MKGALFSKCRRIIHKGRMIFAPGGDFIPAKNAGGELFMANIAPRASFFQEFLRFFILGRSYWTPALNLCVQEVYRK